MFRRASGTPNLVWMPLVYANVNIVVGGIVTSQANEGITPMVAASGAADTTGKLIPLGICVGLNIPVDNQTFSSTYNSEIFDADSQNPHTSTLNYTGQEGVWPKGGREAFALIDVIDPTTLIKGDIFNGAHGTAISVGTNTAASTTGVAFTSDTALATGVATLSTVYFRTGNNKEIYRVTDDTSSTAVTWDTPTPWDTAVGDTAVRVNLRSHGISRMQTDALGTYIEGQAASTADYYIVNVIKLDLSTAGAEFCIFRFTGDHFCTNRA